MNTVVRQRQVEPDVLNVLAAAECEGHGLRLVGQLDRKLYVRTNEVLEALGGKWNKKAKAHLFDGDAADLVDEVVLTGTFSKTKQDFGFFETPANIVAEVVAAAHLKPGMTVLEPSAGRGAIADVARNAGADVFCVELQEKNCRVLRDKKHGYLQFDFMEWGVLGPSPERQYDRVLMNPPFAKRADIHHIMRATKFLKPGGELVAIASASVMFRDDALARDFRDFVRAHFGMIVALPDGSFKESGTMVNTVLVTLETSKH